MPTQSRINIISSRPLEFSNKIEVDDVTYIVQTEDMGTKTNKIISNVYLKGEVVFSRKSDYAHLAPMKDFAGKLAALMENQHKNTIDLFMRQIRRKEKSKSDYLEEIKPLLRRGNGKSALAILKQAVEKFPDDPYLLSFCGYLTATVENKRKEGIEMCLDAIDRLGKASPFGTEFLYPAFYLNLGRAYLTDNKKSEALRAFYHGLKSDPENRDILWEIKKLGPRRRPVLPFLSRSSPLNKYLGMLLYKSA